MGGIILLFLIFCITVIAITIFPVHGMTHDEGFRTSVKNLWGIVKICQTSNFGKPCLTLKPARRTVELNIDFLDADRVSISLPLILKKQQKAKDEYIKIFSDHDLVFHDAGDQLTVYLDRKDENLGHKITHLYRNLFDVTNTDSLRFSAHLVSSDLRALQGLKRPNFKFPDTYSYEAHTARYEGKSAWGIQISRYLNAVSWLLFAPLIIISYTYFGLNFMCWAALFFYGFFATYRSIYEKKDISQYWGSLIHFIFISVTLATQNTNYLQIIPSLCGAIVVLVSGAMVLGVCEPTSHQYIQQKEKQPNVFRASQSVTAFAGFGLWAVNEWARRHLDLDSWIWFYAFIRLEVMLVLAIIAIPFCFFWLNKKTNAS